MINPATIDPLTLPSVAMAERKALPEVPCIYFAIDSTDAIQYIGRSVNPRQRWQTHHRQSQVLGCRIAYMQCDAALLDQVEQALIEWFHPVLNWTDVAKTPRRSVTFRLDRRALEALDRLAQDSNLSATRYLENLLFAHAKSKGKIPLEARPLGEMRGGARVKGEPDPSVVDFKE